MGWGGSNFFLAENESHIYRICVPNLVAVRRSCRKGGGVQRDRQTDKGKLQLYIVDVIKKNLQLDVHRPTRWRATPVATNRPIRWRAIKGKGSFYIAQYPVRWTAQSALHFLPPLADLFIPTQTRLLREAFYVPLFYVPLFQWQRIVRLGGVLFQWQRIVRLGGVLLQWQRNVRLGGVRLQWQHIVRLGGVRLQWQHIMMLIVRLGGVRWRCCNYLTGKTDHHRVIGNHFWALGDWDDTDVYRPLCAGNFPLTLNDGCHKGIVTQSGCIII